MMTLCGTFGAMLELGERKPQDGAADGVELLRAAHREAFDRAIERVRLLNDRAEQLAEVLLIRALVILRRAELIDELVEVVIRDLPLIERLDEQLPGTMPGPARARPGHATDPVGAAA